VLFIYTRYLPLFFPVSSVEIGAYLLGKYNHFRDLLSIHKKLRFG
jgi:hypothetical protein